MQSHFFESSAYQSLFSLLDQIWNELERHTLICMLISIVLVQRKAAEFKSSLNKSDIIIFDAPHEWNFLS